MRELFLELKNITLQVGDAVVLNHINWEIGRGEHWAIVGPIGSGKSLLAEAINGKYYLKEGEIVYHFESFDKTSSSSSIAYISFSENSYVFNYSNKYYQQRFNSLDSENSITVREFFQGRILSHHIESIFKLSELYDLNFIKLSNGQTRKVRLANALSKNPKLVILDDPFIGLDDQSRIKLEEVINALAESGTQIILITNRNQLPESITHVLEMENLHIRRRLSKADFEKSDSFHNQNHQDEKIKKLMEALPADNADFEIAAALRQVNIGYNEKNILKNVVWTIKKGEKWALLGANGAGKSTLLSLITGDNPQAYSQNIVLFDRQKGSGESIWDIKKKIGFLSPEFHLYFRNNMTCFEVAATGYLDTLYLSRKPTDEEGKLINTILAFFDFSGLRDSNFLSLSTGQQRIILFIRALIKNPPLLILDEPFQGVDHVLLKKCIRLLEFYCTSEKTVIFVTHLKEEIPFFVDRVFYLENGEGKEERHKI